MGPDIHPMTLSSIGDMDAARGEQYLKEGQSVSEELKERDSTSEGTRNEKWKGAQGYCYNPDLSSTSSPTVRTSSVAPSSSSSLLAPAALNPKPKIRVGEMMIVDEQQEPEDYFARPEPNVPLNRNSSSSTTPRGHSPQVILPRFRSPAMPYPSSNTVDKSNPHLESVKYSMTFRYATLGGEDVEQVQADGNEMKR